MKNPETKLLPVDLLPPEILTPLLEARERWSRTEYLNTPRVMARVGIDAALDDMLAYNQSLIDFEKVFNHA